MIDYDMIGKRIKEIRLERNITQEELARSMEISTAFLSRIETGRTKISLTRLNEISEKLDINTGYLLIGNSRISNDNIYDEFQNLLEKCTPEQQKFIFNISKMIYKIIIKK